VREGVEVERSVRQGEKIWRSVREGEKIEVLDRGIK
jgi:hypothetical protein